MPGHHSASQGPSPNYLSLSLLNIAHPSIRLWRIFSDIKGSSYKTNLFIHSEGWLLVQYEVTTSIDRAFCHSGCSVNSCMSYPSTILSSLANTRNCAHRLIRQVNYLIVMPKDRKEPEAEIRTDSTLENWKGSSTDTVLWGSSDKRWFYRVSSGRIMNSRDREIINYELVLNRPQS